MYYAAASGALLVSNVLDEARHVLALFFEELTKAKSIDEIRPLYRRLHESPLSQSGDKMRFHNDTLVLSAAGMPRFSVLAILTISRRPQRMILFSSCCRGGQRTLAGIVQKRLINDADCNRLEKKLLFVEESSCLL